MLEYTDIYAHIHMSVCCIFFKKLVHCLSWKKVSTIMEKPLAALLLKECISDFIVCVNEMREQLMVF